MQRPLVLAVLLAIAIASCHALFALSVPGMSDDTAYLHMRQVESIRSSGLPLIDDPFAPDGKRLLVTPFHDYVLAAFSPVVGVVVALKVVPAVVVGVLVLMVFWLTFRLTRGGWASLCAAVAAAAMPMLFSTGLNTASPAPLVLVLTLGLMLQLIGRTSIAWFVLLVILLSFAHPSVVIVLLGLLFFGVLLLISEMKLEQGNGEIMLFSTLFIVWSLTVRFKDSLVALGPIVVFQNVPVAMAAYYFAQPSMLDAVLLVGIVPALLGGHVIYTFLFREQRRDIYLLLGFALAMGVLIWLSIVDWRLGLTFLGVILCVLFGVWVQRTGDYLGTTRAASWRWPLGVLLIIAICLTSALPAADLVRDALAKTPSQQELDALASLSLPAGSVMLTMPEEGFRVEALAHVKVVQDLDFVTQHDAPQRYDDVQRSFLARSKVDAVALLNKYHVTHIYLSERTLATLGSPSYASDYSCFPRRYEGAVQVLESTCKVERQ